MKIYQPQENYFSRHICSYKDRDSRGWIQAVRISDRGVKRTGKMGSKLGLGSTFQGKVLHFILSPVTRRATLNQFPRNTKLHKIMIIT